MPTPTPTPAPAAVGESVADTGSAGQSSLTLALPFQVATGQLLLATVAIESLNGAAAGTATITVPAGWTELRHDACEANFQMSLAYRIAQPGDIAGAPFVWNFSGTFTGAGGLVAFTGISGVSPFEASSFQCTPDSSTLTAPSITTTVDNSLDLLVYGIAPDNVIQEPNDYRELFDWDSPDSGPVVANDLLLIPASATATGDQVTTVANAGDNIGYQLGLSPPTSTAVATPTATNIPTATASATPTSMITPTPSPAASPAPTPTPSPTATPTPTPSPSPATTETPTPLPTLTPVSTQTATASPTTIAIVTPTPTPIATPTLTPAPTPTPVVAVPGGTLTLSRGGVRFGVVGTDTGPYQRTVIIKNAGKGTLTGGVDLSGISAPFAATGGGVFSLPHGREVLIVVTFNPPPTLGKFTGTIAISSSDPNTPFVNLPVSARAYAGRLAAPKSVKFGTVAVGKTKKIRLTIRNAGVGVLHGSVDASSISGPDFSVLSGGGPFVLNEHQRQEVVLQFAPTGSGSSTATLTLTSDEPGRASVTVNLIGKGK
jgi:hypothetical protein